MSYRKYTLTNLILFSNIYIFQDKFSNIISKSKLITINVSFIHLCYDILLGCVVYFYSFSTSFSEVLYIMLDSKSSSPIIPLHISLFHKLDLILTPFIFNIINISLHSGIVPSSLKHAII